MIVQLYELFRKMGDLITEACRTQVSIDGMPYRDSRGGSQAFVILAYGIISGIVLAATTCCLLGFENALLRHLLALLLLLVLGAVSLFGIISGWDAARIVFVRRSPKRFQSGLNFRWRMFITCLVAMTFYLLSVSSIAAIAYGSRGDLELQEIWSFALGMFIARTMSLLPQMSWRDVARRL